MAKTDDLGKKDYFVCQVCGYPTTGEPPDKCSVCGASKEDFYEVK